MYKQKICNDFIPSLPKCVTFIIIYKPSKVFQMRFGQKIQGVLLIKLNNEPGSPLIRYIYPSTLSPNTLYYNVPSIKNDWQIALQGTILKNNDAHAYILAINITSLYYNIIVTFIYPYMFRVLNKFMVSERPFPNSWKLK